MHYKAVVFDFGGVIELFGASSLGIASEILSVPADEFAKTYYEHNHLANVQNLSWNQMFEKVISVFSKDEGG